MIFNKFKKNCLLLLLIFSSAIFGAAKITQSTELQDECKKNWFTTINSQNLFFVKLILSVNKDLIDSQNEDGNTASHLAIIKKNAALFELLITYNPNINLANNEGNTLLHLAILNTNLPIIRSLLENKDIDVFATNKYNQTIQHFVEAVNITEISNLIGKKLHSICSSFLNDDQDSLLAPLTRMTSIVNGHLESSSIALKRKASAEPLDIEKANEGEINGLVDVNDDVVEVVSATKRARTNGTELVSTDKDKETDSFDIQKSILEECKVCHKFFERDLLAKHLDSHEKKESLPTALKVQDRNTQKNTQSSLTSVNSSTNTTEVTSSLAPASVYSCAKCFKQMSISSKDAHVKQHEDVIAKTEILKRTLWIQAIEKSDNIMLKKLLPKNCNVNLVNKDGNSAVHIAVMTTDLELLRQLIAKNANITLANNMRKTALDLANNSEIIKVLKACLN